MKCKRPQVRDCVINQRPAYNRCDRNRTRDVRSNKHGTYLVCSPSPNLGREKEVSSGRKRHVTERPTTMVSLCNIHRAANNYGVDVQH